MGLREKGLLFSSATSPPWFGGGLPPRDRAPGRARVAGQSFDGRRDTQDPGVSFARYFHCNS